ncbi:MAG: hypothetical protein WAK48_04165, partial [Candidatus Acidiferrum sp.]
GWRFRSAACDGCCLSSLPRNIVMALPLEVEIASAVQLFLHLARKGESLVQLLTRLDQAIAKANKEGVFTDEINSPVDSTRR